MLLLELLDCLFCQRTHYAVDAAGIDAFAEAVALLGV
jgi:hypothetical protein